MKLAIILSLVLGGYVVSSSDDVVLRVQTGTNIARVTVLVPQRAEHRALEVVGAVYDPFCEGECHDLWYTRSVFPLDGDKAPRGRTLQDWRPNAGLLRVRANVYGLCGSGDAAAIVR